MRPSTQIFGIQIADTKALVLSMAALAGFPTMASAQECTFHSLVQQTVTFAEGLTGKGMSIQDENKRLSQYNDQALGLPKFDWHHPIRTSGGVCRPALIEIEHTVLRSNGLQDKDITATAYSIARKFRINPDGSACCPQ